MNRYVADSSGICKTGQGPTLVVHRPEAAPTPLTIPVQTIARAGVNSGWGWEDIAVQLNRQGLLFDPWELREFIVKGGRV